MKLLFLVRGYFPDISASGNLLKNLTDYLSRDHDVTVFCFSKNSNNENINNVRVIRENVISNKKPRYINSIKNKFVIDYYDDTIVNSTLKFLNSINYDQYDQIIATTYEEAIALSLCKVEKQKKSFFLLEKIPYINFFKTKFFSYKIKRNQSDFFEKFNKIFYLDDIFQSNDFLQKYDGSSEFVSVKHPMIRELNKSSRYKGDKDSIELLYGGGLDKRQRNPLRIIKFLQKISEYKKINFKIFSYGNYQKRLNKLQKKFRFLEVNKPIDSEQFYIEAQESDILISIGNKQHDIIPSKIYDYLSFRKPIIHFTQTDNDYYYELLKGYPHAIVVSISEMENLYDDIIDFIKQEIHSEISYSCLETYFPENTPEYVGKIFTESIMGKNNE